MLMERISCPINGSSFLQLEMCTRKSDVVETTAWDGAVKAMMLKKRATSESVSAATEQGERIITLR